MTTPRRFVQALRWSVAGVVVTGSLWLFLEVVMLQLVPAQVASDRPPLARLLAEAGIAVPPEPFPAPSFSVPDLAGGTVDLDGLRGRVVLLYFWTTW